MRFLDRTGGGQPYESVEMGSNETTKQAVIASLGIALISFHTVTGELRTGRPIAPQVRNIPIMRSWFVLHRQALSGATQRVLDFIRAQKDGFLPKL